MRKTLTSLLGATAMVVLVTLAAPQPAPAATGFARCPAGKFCIFTEAGGGGVMAMFDYADGNLGDGVGPQGMNDDVVSVYNHTAGQYWATFRDPGYGTPGELYTPGYKGLVRPILRNEISSLCRARNSGGTTCT